jgi:RNA polymerase sigma-70 factor (ECF subfamily)
VKQYSNRSDEWLMQQVSNDNLDAMATLFERYNLALYNFFRRFNFDASKSEDMTQMVFERMLKYKHSYQIDSNFRTWMYQIARNLKADYFKKEEKFKDNFTNLSTIEDAVDNSEERFIKKEQEEFLKKAMNALNKEQRELLILTKFQALKYAQVAQMLNCTEGTVKVKVHRAIKNLKKQFFRIAKEY